MDATLQDPDDRSRLTGPIRDKKDAMQRDRFRAITFAINAKMTLDIEVKPERNEIFVQHWANASRDRGANAIKPCNKCLLAPDNLEQFRQRVIPTPIDAGESVQV